MRNTLIAGWVCPLIVSAVGADEKTDAVAVNAWLVKEYPKKKWQTGPTRLDSAEVKKAYSGETIYFVFSAPPLPPGAPSAEFLKRYEAEVAEFRANYISVVVKIDAKGNVSARKTTPADLNEGLMKVTTDDEAQIAAAAILSLLHVGRTGPGAVSADLVKVKRLKDEGWTCEANKSNAFRGTVSFDKNGKCVSASKQDASPLPP